MLAACLATGVVACGGSTDKTRLPNPASVYCEDQGAKIEIVDESGGQVGYCVFPDGTRVEEWAYYRAHATTTG